MKWERPVNGNWYGKGKHAEYIVSGWAMDWWITFDPQRSADDVVWMSYNLGWAPTVDIAKRRCHEIEKWLNGRVKG